MSKFVCLLGSKFELLTVDSRAPNRSGGVVYWNCICDCGKEVCVRSSALKAGITKSCGCFRASIFVKRVTKHGLSQTLTGRTWNAMMQRCYNTKDEHFKDYGGRGIFLCDFLKSTPFNLLALLGERPSVGHSLDRIDNQKGYFCGICEECIKNERVLNVRWATPLIQIRNRRNTVFVSINGIRKTASEWASIFNWDYVTFYSRFRRHLKTKESQIPVFCLSKWNIKIPHAELEDQTLPI